jgi:hypothetical protein
MNDKEPIKIASWIGVGVTAKGESAANNRAQIHLYTDSGVDDGAYYPSQHIHVYGQLQVLALRDFCDKVLENLEQFEEKK